MNYRLILITLLLPLAMTAEAQDPGEPTLMGIDSNIADMDISGSWNDSTSNHKVQGRCPVGTAMSGTLMITLGADGLGLQVVSGAVCVPVYMCSQRGEFNSGNALFSDVDDEGGWHRTP